MVDLDQSYYRVVNDFDALFPEGGVPSLIDCESLRVDGPVAFDAGVTIQGKVHLKAAGPAPRRLSAGRYRDQVIEL